jgi:hypothetical protein
MPGAAAQEAAAPPVAVSSATTGGEAATCPSDGTVGEADGVRQTRGAYCHPIWTMDDPRLQGTVTWADNEDAFLDESGLRVTVLGVRVENDEGAWRMVPEVMFEPTAFDTGPLPARFVMVGEGAYEGYYAVLAFTHQEIGTSMGRIDGFIVQGEQPPAPDAVAIAE